ncbi:MAG: CHASE3 domain-containing protein [Verrucomicrobia bacterium]|nr:CHASE3 domain-containing protein [Cytophagales bacterium]
MKLKPDLLLKITFILSLSLLLILSLLSYRGMQQYITYANEVNHTHQVINNIEAIMSLMKDAETGQRGYLLTQDSIFLEPYHTALKEMNPIVQQTADLVKDNRLQTLRIDTLRRLIDEREKILNQAMNLKNQYPQGKQVLYEGKKKMDEIRQLINRMKVFENDLLIERNAQEAKTRSVVSIYTVIIGFCALSLLTGYFFSVRRELKHRMRTQNELEKKVEALKHSNSELEQFAYVASHDLQEPIRKMQAFSSRLLLKYKTDLPEEAQFILEKINDSARRMQALIDDLLRFSRLVNKTGVKELTDLNKVVGLIQEDFSELITEKSVIIYSDSLPTVEAFPSQMRQLFQNLISNSLKFSKKEVAPEIKINCELAKGSEIATAKDHEKSIDFYKISVIDNGIGFDEKYLEKIFVIFQRLHNRTEYSGTGIGLAVCKRIMSNHEGYILAEGEVGKGATFIIYLPKFDGNH